MQQPFFSIVCPIYNRANTIGRTIDSVLKQKFLSWELILINDGSTDNTENVVLTYKDERIKYVFQENQERSASRNKAIDMAKANFICFIDSDDYYLDDHLEVLSSFIIKSNNKKALYYTGGYKQRENNRLVPNPTFDEKLYKHPIHYIIKNSLLINSVCVHKDIFKSHHFNTKYSNWEDTELWIRICAEYSFFFIPQYTTVAARDMNLDVSNSYLKYHPRDWNWKLAMLKLQTLKLDKVIASAGADYLMNYISSWFFEFSISLIYHKDYKGASQAYKIAYANNRNILFSKKSLSFLKAILLSVKP